MKLTVDAVIFGYVENDLKILLIKRKYDPYKDNWALPGGFVNDNESLDEAVLREVSEETGIENLFLEQLYSFGDVRRDPRDRIVSISYYGLIKPEQYKISESTNEASDVKWFSVSNLPKLAFDHKKIIDTAYIRLQGKVVYQPIGFELLPTKFPFSDLQNLYETILNQKFDRRNFRKKFMKLDILDELDEKRQNALGKPANLFQFNIEKYREKTKHGFYFEI